MSDMMPNMERRLIRQRYDSSFISTKGILTPNYFTGAHNFHSYCEFMPMDAVEKSCLMTLKLIELITEKA